MKSGTGAKGKGGINYGTGLYDPEQSSRILENMQAFKNQREGASRNMMSPLDQHLQGAIAYGTGNPDDILNIQKQSQENAKSAFDMQLQIEQFKAGQARQAAFNKFQENFIKDQLQKKANAANGGGGGDGIDENYLPGSVLNALGGTNNFEDWAKIINKHAEIMDTARAGNVYNIEWNKNVILGLKGADGKYHNHQMTLKDAQPYLRGEGTIILDPTSGQQLDANGKPTISPNTSAPSNRPAIPKFTPDPSLVPKSRAQYKEGGSVQHYADGNSVFADVPPTLVADATPTIPVTAKRIKTPDSYPISPEEVQKINDITNTVETTGGNEREKKDAEVVKKLEESLDQIHTIKPLVKEYQKFVDEKPHLFGPITSHPILNAVVPFLEGLPGIKNYPDNPEEHPSHGFDLRQALTNAEIAGPDLAIRKRADSLATLLGISYAKVNFPGRMTNIELQQQQKGKGLKIDDPALSNQLSINSINHDVNRVLGVGNAWQHFKDQEQKLGHRPTWSNFESTDAYGYWRDLPSPNELPTNKSKEYKTDNGHVVKKIGN